MKAPMKYENYWDITESFAELEKENPGNRLGFHERHGVAAGSGRACMGDGDPGT